MKLSSFLSEYTERNTENKYRPVAVGRYGIRTRESIYSKELAKDYSKNKVIGKNTLTVGMGSVQIDIGILTDDVKYSVSPAYHTYTITGINPDYLRYCLECRNQDMFERYVKRGSRQGKTIDLGRWLTYEIPVGSESNQQEIVSQLDFVESLITARREQLEKLDELVKSRFIELFGDSQTNPKRWKVEPAEKHIDLLSGFSFDSSQYTDDGVNICGGLIIMPQRIEWDECKHWRSVDGFENYTLRKNDIVIALFV
jgi:type I restriction enzyme S subunit